MKITAKARKSALIGKGLHLATIQSISETVSKSGTPQLEMKLVNGQGLVRMYWFNLRGYKTNAKGDYVDSKNRMIEYLSLPEGSDERHAALAKRVEDPEKTQTCLEILEKFAGDLGFEEDEDINTDDFVEKQLYIVVTDDGVAGNIKYMFGVHKEKDAEYYASKFFGVPVTAFEEDFDSI